MTQPVCKGAMLQSSFGDAPSPRVLLPAGKTLTSGMQAAAFVNNKPMLNTVPAGMYNFVAHPMVLAATAVGLGNHRGGLIQINMAGEFTRWSS